ncbi:MAG: pyruvate kinase [Roseburia sp.]|nr:pyruvate kinase [Roseburia sp.]
MQTKIYGTIGPACQETDTLVRLFEKGMTGVRINLSHSNLAEAAEWLENIQSAYQSGCKEDTPEILMDLRGPELRIGKIIMPRKLEEGDGITLAVEGYHNLLDPTEISVPALVMKHLKPGQEVLLDDGKLQLVVEELFSRVGVPIGSDVQAESTSEEDCKSMAGSDGVGPKFASEESCNYMAECRVLRGGILKGGKSIALPGVALYPPTLTESDLVNIRVAKKYGITGVMLPFVRGKEDLQNLKQALEEADAADIRVFAKIENLDGVEKLPELLPYCDEIVIARGDLGNAMPLWELPVVQEQIAAACRTAGKPFMVVTQMLASMEQAAVPTRAEVSDIFRAVQQGSASVMLTGETAAGKYPVEAMEYMVNTVRAAERYIG